MYDEFSQADPFRSPPNQLPEDRRPPVDAVLLLADRRRWRRMSSSAPSRRSCFTIRCRAYWRRTQLWLTARGWLGGGRLSAGLAAADGEVLEMVAVGVLAHRPGGAGGRRCAVEEIVVGGAARVGA